MPADFEIEFKIMDNQGAVVIVDGQDIYEIEQNQSIKNKNCKKKQKCYIEFKEIILKF